MNVQTKVSPSVDLKEEGKRLADDPSAFFGDSLTAMQTVDRDTLAALQLEGLKYRFGELRSKIPMLDKLAGKQGIETLETVDDVAPILFEHTIYKSYPPALLEKGRFADINRWLSKLTVYDLTAIDVSQCQSIDDWMEVLDRESPLKISHSSGTSGTMSFLPISKAEWEKFGRMMRTATLQRFGEEPDLTSDSEIDVIYPFFRSGGSSHLRVNDVLAKYIAGSEERMLMAYPSRMSSDVLYLAAKIRAAQSKGELDRLQISPNLLERQKEFDRLESTMAADVDRFFDRMTSELRGRRVYMAGTWNILHGMAKRGLEQGAEGVFAANSVVSSGGGAKGMTPPENWKEDVCRYLGIDKIQMGYAMSEVMGMHQMCEHGHYHLAPWIIPILLDPETSEVLPRHGAVTGRAAFFDLGAETRWGGFITGDEITINWDETCGCGRTTIFLEGEISRFSEKNGGDDKISCAATENAHKEAMDFLTKFE